MPASDYKDRFAEVFPTEIKVMSLSMQWRRIGGVEICLHSFLTSDLEEGQWPISLPGSFITGQESWYQLYRRLRGAQSSSGRLVEEKLLPCGGMLTPDPATHSSVTIPTTPSLLLLHQHTARTSNRRYTSFPLCDFNTKIIRLLQNNEQFLKE